MNTKRTMKWKHQGPLLGWHDSIAVAVVWKCCFKPGWFWNTSYKSGFTSSERAAKVAAETALSKKR